MILKLARVFLMFGWLLALWAVSRQAACEDAPLFQGRSLTSWVNDLAQGRDPDMAKHNDAVKALRGMGAEAIPISVVPSSQSSVFRQRGETARNANVWHAEWSELITEN